jgi:hypothetical protein
MNLISGSYNLESRAASVQRTINLVPVPIEPGNERTAWVFKDAPGMVQAVADDGWDAEPSTVSTIQYKTQTAAAGNGGLSAFGEFPWPETSTTGDLGILVVFTEPARTLTATTGWDEIDTFICNSGAAGAVCKVFARVKQEGDTGVIASIDGGNGFINGQFIVYEDQRADYFDIADGLTNQTAANPLLFANPSVEFSGTQVLLIAIRAGLSWPWFVLATYAPGNLTDSEKASDTGWTAGGRQAAFSVVRATHANSGPIGTVSGSTTVSSQYSTRVIALR